MNKMTPAMQRAIEQYQRTGNTEGVHHKTLAALQRRGVLQGSVTVAESGADPRPNRLIARFRNRNYDFTTPTFDVGQPDWDFWTRASRGRVNGLELSGLFLKPLASKKAAWVFGTPPKVRVGDSDADTAFNEWLMDNHSDVLRAYEESAKKGDCYLVINPDLSITVLPARVVEPIVDDNDYSKKLGYRVTEVYAHPTQHAMRMTIVDEYLPTGRKRIYKKNGQVIRTQSFDNPSGVVPIIHIPNNAEADEEYGHPEGEALIELFHKYGAVFDWAFFGNQRQGRPTPVLEQMGDMDAIERFWKKFGRMEKYIESDGTERYQSVIDFDSDKLLTLPNGAQFKYASPGSFAGDTEKLLQILFYLMLQHTEIPEFIWGNAIGSSKASADAQMLPFVKWVEKQQGQCGRWMKQIVRAVLAFMNLYDTSMPAEVERITLRWSQLTSEDGRLTLDAILAAWDRGALDDETAISLMPLDIEDPREVLERARRERAEREAERRRQEDALDNPLSFEDEPSSEDEDEDTPDENATDEDVEEMVREHRIAVGEQHTGIMVGFFLPEDAARRLAAIASAAGLETNPDDLHLTLAYMGDTSDTRLELSMAQTVCEVFAQRSFPVMGEVGGVGRFKAGPDGVPVYVTCDAPALPKWRQNLVDHLAEWGLPVAENHGFMPHITLAYLDAAAPMPNIILPEDFSITFTQLTLAWGNQRFVFPLDNSVREIRKAA